MASLTAHDETLEQRRALYRAELAQYSLRQFQQARDVAEAHRRASLDSTASADTTASSTMSSTAPPTRNSPSPPSSTKHSQMLDGQRTPKGPTPPTSSAKSAGTKVVNAIMDFAKGGKESDHAHAQ